MKLKSKKTRLFAVILSMVILFCSIPTASMNAANQAPSVDKMISEQAQAVEANEILMQFFFAESKTLEYPSYFGGCYIEDNVLHIRLAAPTAEEIAILEKILCNHKDVIIFEYSDHSQASLQNYADKTAAELKKQGIAVTFWYVEVETGNVIIGVLPADMDTATAKIAKMQNASPTDPKIIITEGGYSVPTSNSTVVGGSAIIIGAALMSAGTCGYYEGNNALVTCGHGNTIIGSTVVLNGTDIGTVTKVQYANEQFGDYSIIELESALMSHKIGNSSDAIITINNGTYLAPAVGTYVTKYGCITGYSYGTVTATNAVITSNIGTTIFGMTIASISSGAGSIPGDSGGPYLAANAFCGVHHGHLSSDNSTVIFTPYSLILQGGFSAIGEHICARWTDIGPANHSGYCTICNETIYEVHSKYWDNFYGECTRCGRRDLIMVG